MNGNSFSNRILGGAFAASVVINLGWVTLVSHSGLFGAASSITQLHEKQFRVFKPIPQKPRPRHKDLPPLPPPKQKPPPKIQPLKPIQVVKRMVKRMVEPKPHLTTTKPLRSSSPLHPNPPVRSAPSAPSMAAAIAPAIHVQTPPVTHPVQMARTMGSQPSDIPLPSSLSVSPPTRPFVSRPSAASILTKSLPSEPVQAPSPPAKAAAVPQKVVEQPKLAAQKSPQMEVHHPAEVHHPDHWVDVDVQEASVPDNIEINMDDISRDSVDNDKVVVSYILDETGHVRHARVTTQSGNSELDNRVLEAVKRLHGIPAVQDHIPRETSRTYTYNIQ